MTKMRARSKGAWAKTVTLSLAAVALVGCQTTSNSPQSQPSYLSSYGLGEIVFNYSRVDEPLHVSSLEASIRKKISGGSTLTAVSTRLGLANQVELRRELEKGINANIRPHVRDAFGRILTGSKPLRVEVLVRSVFIRGRLSLQQLTGVRVFVNGKKRPDNAQLIAGLRLYDQASGAFIQEVNAIKKVDEGGTTLWSSGPKAPNYGSDSQLNKLSFAFAQTAANAVKQLAGSGEAIIPGSQGDVNVIYSRTTRTTF